MIGLDHGMVIAYGTVRVSQHIEHNTLSSMVMIRNRVCVEDWCSRYRDQGYVLKWVGKVLHAWWVARSSL